MPVINRDTSNKPKQNVKFISYAGKWPNLCSGVLTLEICGTQYKFGNVDGCDFMGFWRSGGSCGFTDDYDNTYVTTGAWIIDELNLPDEFKQYADEIDRVFNDNVGFGCCGGCL